VAEAIQKTATEENVSLIIMGAQGKGLVEGILLGSVSTEVLRHGETDLLLIRHQVLEGNEEKSLAKFCPNIFSRLLVTTDFSPAAQEAVSLVKSLEGIFEILLVHVITKGEDFNKAAQKLNLMRDELAGSGSKITVHILEGDPAEEVMSNPSLSKGHPGPRDGRPGADFASIQLTNFKTNFNQKAAKPAFNRRMKYQKEFHPFCCKCNIIFTN
jgi:nucleotide-binding universal stress UspA family protein